MTTVNIPSFTPMPVMSSAKQPSRPPLIFRARRFAARRLALLRTLRAPVYAAPSPSALADIERALRALAIEPVDYRPEQKAFADFCARFPFPESYLAAFPAAIRLEKQFEHFVAHDLLGLDGYTQADTYVDIAACASPWVEMLRQGSGLPAIAIDLAVAHSYSQLPYYQQQNATATRFGSASISGASLQCAYEMFQGNDDIALLAELARVLKPGGRCVIAPLYLHTHHCGYSTPEYYGRGYADSGAKEYLRRDCWGVPFSRKYDADALLRRVLLPIEQHGMRYRLHMLRNAQDIAPGLYCHCILEIIR